MIEEQARGARRPPCREARAVMLQGRTLLVSVRSRTGDTRPVPARGYCPRVRDTGSGLELFDVERGDPVWVTEDEGRQLVVVTWEPKG